MSPLEGRRTGPGLQSTVIATTIRNGEHWRRRQFSWTNEWEEMSTRAGRVEGMEFVLPDWFYSSVIDRSLVLTIDPAYFRLTGGIERWLCRIARKHAGRQRHGWVFVGASPRQVGQSRARVGFRARHQAHRGASAAARLSPVDRAQRPLRVAAHPARRSIHSACEQPCKSARQMRHKEY